MAAKLKGQLEALCNILHAESPAKVGWIVDLIRLNVFDTLTTECETMNSPAPTAGSSAAKQHAVAQYLSARRCMTSIGE